jgi:tetratricopeptide (TPR) repeat protein
MNKAINVFLVVTIFLTTCGAALCDTAVDFNNRGLAMQAKGDFDGAISNFTKAIELKPDDGSAYYNRGSVKQDKGDLDGAIADFSKAIELKPDDEDGRFGFGGDIFLKAQNDAAVFLGKMRGVNQPLCDGWVAMQNPGGGIFQLVADGRLFTAENLDYHNSSIAARIAASSTSTLTASIFSPVRTARLMPRAT